MRKTLMFVSCIALAFILMSAVLCATAKVSPDTNRLFILVGTIAWFVVTPMWLRKNSREESSN
jgi:hypothetical protein